MPPTGLIMTQGNDFMKIIIKHTSRSDLVWAIFEQVWIIQGKKLCLG